ncbi:MAG: hypothetical protein USCGTAYLOR_01444 [Chromatiales bacterium USCg_Taylor]|nr:MAG: hypothetical protein USCGTAYLOR_01444 [Chromatiales bacterium USCg_Taylor]
MHAGFVFVVKNESRWVIPRCIVGKANNRLVRLPLVGEGFSVTCHQGLSQTLLKGNRYVHLLLVYGLHQGIDLVRKG